MCFETGEREPYVMRPGLENDFSVLFLLKMSDYTTIRWFVGWLFLLCPQLNNLFPTFFPLCTIKEVIYWNIPYLYLAASQWPASFHINFMWNGLQLWGIIFNSFWGNEFCFYNKGLSKLTILCLCMPGFKAVKRPTSVKET